MPGDYKVSISLDAKVRGYLAGIDSATKATTRLSAAQHGLVGSSRDLEQALTRAEGSAKATSTQLRAASWATTTLEKRTAALTKEQQKLRALPPLGDTMGRQLNSVTKVAGNAETQVKGLGKAAVITAAGLAAAGGSLHALGPALLAVGATAGALPGILGGAAAQMGVLKVATAGVSDALGEVYKEKDPFARLSPSAKALVDRLGELKPRLLALQEGFQERVFAGAVGNLDRIASVTLPRLQTAANRLADNWSHAFAEITNTVTDGQVIYGLNVMARTADGFFDGIVKQIRPLGEALSTIVVEADPLTRAIGDGVVGAIERFTEAVKRAQRSGDLGDFFAAGAENAQAFVSIAGDVASILSSVVSESTKQNTTLVDAAASLDAYVASGRAASDVAGIVNTLTVAYQGMADVLGPLAAVAGKALADPGTVDSLRAMFQVLAAGSEALAKVVGLVLDLNNATHGVLLGFAAFALVGAKFVGLTTKIGVAATGAATKLTAMGVASQGAAGKMAGLGTAMNAVLAGLVAGQFAGDFADQFLPKPGDVDKVTASIERYARTGAVTGELTRLFGDNLDSLGVRATTATGSLGTVGRAVEGLVPGLQAATESIFGQSFTGNEERFKTLDVSLAKYAQTTSDAAGTSEFFNAVLARTGLSQEQLANLLPTTWAELQRLQSETHAGAGSMNSMTERAELLGVGLNELVTKGRSVIDVFNKLNGAAASVADAEIAAEQGIDDLTAALEKNGRALTKQKDGFDTTNKKGRENLELTVAQTRNAAAIADAVFIETKSVEQAAGAYTKYTAQLRDALVKGGLAPGVADRIIAKYGAMPTTFNQAGAAVKGLNDQLASTPKGKNIPVTTPGLSEATPAFVELQKKIKAVERSIRLDVTAHGVPAAEAQLAGLLVRQKALKEGISIPVAQARYNKQKAIAEVRADGGPVWGAGTETSDDIPAWLSNGEWVIRAKSAKKLGPQKMAYINKYGELPSFAGGGTLHAPFPVTAAMTRIPSLAEVSKAVAGAIGPTGSWPSSPGSQRGDSGVWHNILALVKNSGIPYQFGNAYRPGDPKWHGSGRAIDFTGYNQDALANFFVKMRPKVLELIHRTKYGDYGISRGQFHAMPTQWPLHENHLHVAMKDGGVIREPVFGVGRSGTTYSFGEGGRAEAVTPLGMANGGLVNVARTPVDARGSRMDTQEAYISARDAVVSLNAALKTNGATLSVNTSRGRANRSELISGVRAAQSAAEAKFNETGSVRLANAAYDEHIRRLRRVLAQQKVSAATIRLLMRELATAPQYDRPDKTLPNSLTNIAFAKSSAGVQDDFAKLRDTLSLNLPTTANTSAEGRENLLGIIGFLESAAGAAQDRFTQTGSSKTAKALYTHYVAALKKALASAGFSKAAAAALIGTYGRVTLQPNAAGGVYGGLSQAATMPAGKTLWQWREPSTGGEAFIPRNGQRERSERALQVAAGWYGGQYMSPTAGAGSGGGYQSHMTVNNYGERMTLAQYNQARRQAAVRARVGRNS